MIENHFPQFPLIHHDDDIVRTPARAVLRSGCLRSERIHADRAAFRITAPHVHPHVFEIAEPDPAHALLVKDILPAMHHASRFKSQIKITRGTRTVDGKSILGLLLLAAPRGATLEIAAAGPDAAAALDALSALVARGFDDA